MTTKVKAAIDEIIRKEGGYVDHPNDRGGPTCWGVTEQVARAYGYTGRMRDLPRETAVAIYHERYWTAPRLQEIALRSEALAEELFDTGVNMGTATAIKFLQRTLNVLNKRQSAYPDIAVDGGVGRMTLNALDALVTWRGAEALKVLLWACNSQQAVRYIELAEKNASQEDFAYGWLLHRAVLA